ncbi:hypothetical protein BH09ACT6_BH09ACT6_23630 [soil metagenome]
MTFTVEEELGRLRDEAAVSEVILHYARGLDQRRFEEVWRCFDADGYMIGTVGEGPVREYLPRLLDRVKTYGSTMHFLGNQLRTVDGDRATTETYGIAHHFIDARGTVEALVVGVRYDDELERRPDGGWLIVKRRTETLWQRQGETI